MMTMINIHRTGRIEFSDKKEGDAICHRATRAEIKRAKVFARLSYDGVTLLVPGIPEAETDEEALAALGASHLEPSGRDAPLIDLIGRLA